MPPMLQMRGVARCPRSAFCLNRSGPATLTVASYWHNSATGVCEPFIYGGCEGKAEPLLLARRVQAACQAAPSTWMRARLQPSAPWRRPDIVGPVIQSTPKAFVVLNQRNFNQYVHDQGMWRRRLRGLPRSAAARTHEAILRRQHARQTNAPCSMYANQELTTCQQDSDCGACDWAPNAVNVALETA